MKVSRLFIEAALTTGNSRSKISDDVSLLRRWYDLVTRKQQSARKQCTVGSFLNLTFNIIISNFKEIIYKDVTY